MSDTQQGPDWWQASDGKWYAPPRPDWPSEPSEEPATPAAAPVAETPAEPAPGTEAPTEVDTSPATDAAPDAPEPVVAPLPVAPPPIAAPPAAAPTEVVPAAATPDAPPPSGPPLAPPAAAGAVAGAAAATGGPPIAPPSGPPTALENAALPAGPPGTGASPAGDPFGTPEKNKTPLIIGGVVAAVIAAIIGFVVFSGDDDNDSTTVSADSEDDPGTIEGDVDSLPVPDPVPSPSDDFAEFVDPADADPISVDESGFILVPDEFDEGSTNASYGFVITNPNAGLAATSVEVSIGLFDEAGTAVETESAFVSGLLGGQSVGLGGFIRDVPDGVVRMEVTAEVSQLVREDELDGELSVSEIAVQEEEFGGITVTFNVSSTFPERQENITLYGLFRNAAGEPIGGTQSFLEFVEAGGTSSAELRSFADIPGIDSVDVAVTISASNFFD